MSMMEAFTSNEIFDGLHRHHDAAILVENGKVRQICAPGQIPDGVVQHDLGNGLLVPGFIDLQVNGGAGLFLNDIVSVGDLRKMCAAHIRLGSTSLLPTLITDRPEITKRVIDLGLRAVSEGCPGFAGLHLEGPHLSRAKKGAHDAGLIRPMTDEDLALYVDAARFLPSLIVTVAPETVSPDQITALSEAGVIVSLGHSAASYDMVAAAAEAGATCVTHLFNAMSPLNHRDPGMVGGALECSGLHAGLIADGIHVAPAAMRIALRVKQRPGHIFLVTDAMSVAGTDLSEIRLDGRRILRRSGKLTLEDGTLAGADLTLPQAVRNVVKDVGVSGIEALKMASVYPATVLGRQQQIGSLEPGADADFLLMTDAFELKRVWIKGAEQPV